MDLLKNIPLNLDLVFIIIASSIFLWLSVIIAIVVISKKIKEKNR